MTRSEFQTHLFHNAAGREEPMRRSPTVELDPLLIHKPEFNHPPETKRE
jgi:hypothetical protein